MSTILLNSYKCVLFTISSTIFLIGTGMGLCIGFFKMIDYGMGYDFNTGCANDSCYEKAFCYSRNMIRCFMLAPIFSLIVFFVGLLVCVIKKIDFFESLKNI